MRFIVWGTIPLGTLAGGALGTWIGLRETIVDRRSRQRALVPLDPALAAAPPARDAGARSTTRPRPSKPCPPKRYRQLHAGATRGGGLGARARPTRLARADRAGRAGAHRDAQDVRAAALGARRPTPRRVARGAGKNLLFPLEGDDLVLRVHLMSAGRLRFLPAGREGAEDADVPPPLRGRRRARPHGGREEEACGRVARHPGAARGGSRATSGPDALELDADGPRRDPRAANAGSSIPSFATSARSRASAARTRTRSSFAHGCRRSRRRRTSRTTRSSGSRPRCTTTSTRALELRERGKGDADVYLVHNRLGEPCPQCGTPIARVDFEEHTIYYCPSCQTGGRLLKDRRLSRLLR